MQCLTRRKAITILSCISRRRAGFGTQALNGVGGMQLGLEPFREAVLKINK